MSSLIALLALITIIISCNGGLIQQLKNASPIEIPPDAATNSDNGCCAFTEGNTCYCTTPTDYKDCNCDSIKQLSVVYLGETPATFIKFYDSFKHPLCKFNNINKGEELICTPLHIFTDRPFTDRTTFKIKTTNNEICSGYVDTSCTGESILNTYGMDCDNIVISGYIDNNNGICDDGYEPCFCDAFNNVHFKSTVSKLRLIIPAIPTAPVSSNIPLGIRSNVNSDIDTPENDPNDIDIKTINMHNIDTNVKTVDFDDIIELGAKIDNLSDDDDTGDESNDEIDNDEIDNDEPVEINNAADGIVRNAADGIVDEPVEIDNEPGEIDNDQGEIDNEPVDIDNDEIDNDHGDIDNDQVEIDNEPVEIDNDEHTLTLYNSIQTKTESLSTDTKLHLHKLILYGTSTAAAKSGTSTGTGTGIARNAADGIVDNDQGDIDNDEIDNEPGEIDSNEHLLMLYNSNRNSNRNIDIDEPGQIDNEQGAIDNDEQGEIDNAQGDEITSTSTSTTEDDDIDEPVEPDIEPTESKEPFTTENEISDPARMDGKIKRESFSIKKHVNKITGSNYNLIAFYSISVILIVNFILFTYCLCVKKIIKKWNVNANRFNYQNGVRSSENDFVESSLSELEVDNDDLTDDETENDFI